MRGIQIAITIDGMLNAPLTGTGPDATLAPADIQGTLTPLLDARNVIRRHEARSVFLDAGHGGSDPGAGNGTRMQEKEVTLERQFEKYVKEPDYESKLGLLHLVDHDIDRALELLAGDYPVAVFVDDFAQGSVGAVFSTLVDIERIELLLDALTPHSQFALLSRDSPKL